MSKFKIERFGGQTLLVVQGQKGQQISEREYYAINNGLVPGLLRAELIRKGNTFKLNYNISGFISLREFLLNPLNKVSFAKLLSNILNNLKALQNAYYNHQYILMDMNAAMVNPTTQQVSFVYVPITFYESGTNLKEFLLSIIQCCSFVPGENTDYVRDYIRILNNGINFSLFDLEEYVKSLNVNDQINNNIKKCTRCGTVIQPNVNFCSSCGMKIAGISVNNPQGVYDPTKNVVKPQAPSIPSDNGVVNVRQGYSETISGGYPANAIQPKPRDLKSPYACVAALWRIKTQETIGIVTEQFRIGKDPHNCEYCITDNPAISRCHAVIKEVGGKWLLTDLNSTNKTYVDNQMLTPNVPVQVYNGTSIKFANEEFAFIIH